MTASELIKELEKAISEHGDLRVMAPEECWWYDVGQPTLIDYDGEPVLSL